MNYISFSLHISACNFTTKNGIVHTKYVEMKFLDSFCFLPDSLDKLSKSLQELNFQTLKYCIPPNLLPDLKRKEVYPYSYIDSYEKFEEHCLPEFGNS